MHERKISILLLQSLSFTVVATITAAAFRCLMTWLEVFRLLIAEFDCCVLRISMCIYSCTKCVCVCTQSVQTTVSK